MPQPPIKQHILILVGEDEGRPFRAGWHSPALLGVKQLIYHSCGTCTAVLAGSAEHCKQDEVVYGSTCGPRG